MSSSVRTTAFSFPLLDRLGFSWFLLWSGGLRRLWSYLRRRSSRDAIDSSIVGSHSCGAALFFLWLGIHPICGACCPSSISSRWACRYVSRSVVLHLLSCMDWRSSLSSLGSL